MSEYKLVPVEPTPEMIDAAREHHEGEAYLPVSLYKAMIAAAPAVQGEPVAYLRKDQLNQVKRMGPMHGEIADGPRVDRVPVYTHPHNGEQDAYPDCDTCGKSMDYMPWHYSMGVERHLHACDECWLEVNGEQGGEWVSVDERQPDEFGEYLAATVARPHGWVIRYAPVGWICSEDYPVTHWMPMPQPPKSKEGEGHE